MPGSGIIFATAEGDESRRLEAQSDEATMSEAMEVLRRMFGRENVSAKPKAFMYPRWGRIEWAYGSYSNWPPSVDLRTHQNLRANVGRMWFAGEATSAEYFGFLHGAYFEGKSMGDAVARCVIGGKCVGESNYKVLHGDTRPSEFNALNSWGITSFWPEQD